MAGTSHPTRRPGSFESQLRKQTNARLFQEAANKKFEEKAKLTTQLKDAQNNVDLIKKSKVTAEKTLASQKAYLQQMKDAAISPSSPGGITITPTELSNIQQQETNISNTQTQVNKYTTMYEDATAKVKAITKELTPGPNTSTKNKVGSAKANKFVGGSNHDNSLFGGISPGIIYKYNAPMVKTSYLNPFGVQGESATSAISDPGNYQDAKNAWSNTLGAKGTIQMSRKYAYSNPAKNTSNKLYDDNLYGFKFLYNPKEVSMSWGTSTEVNWDYVSLGLDKASAVSLGILKSTITFSILLNRTGDMSYVDSNGILSRTDYGTTTSIVHKADDIYPYDVDTDDLKMIYKKGTMYDLEYLFRTIMGLNANYDSTLNGKTADRGWLNAAPVELHLGDGMRYLVRISTLDVNHVIFNERMVPIISTVNVTCHRFYDGTDASLDTSKSSSVDATGSIGNGSEPPEATGSIG